MTYFSMGKGLTSDEFDEVTEAPDFILYEIAVNILAINNIIGNSLRNNWMAFNWKPKKYLLILNVFK